MAPRCPPTLGLLTRGLGTRGAPSLGPGHPQAPNAAATHEPGRRELAPWTGQQGRTLLGATSGVWVLEVHMGWGTGSPGLGHPVVAPPQPGLRGQQAASQLTLTPPVHIQVTRPRPSTPSCLPVGPGDEVLPRGAPAPIQPSEGQGTGPQAGGMADVRGCPQGGGARRPRCSPAQAPAAPRESRDKGSSLSEGRLLSSRGTADSQRASLPFHKHLWVAQAGQQDEQARRHRDPSEPGLVENRKGAQGGDGPASPTPGAPRGEPWAMDWTRAGGRCYRDPRDRHQTPASPHGPCAQAQLTAGETEAQHRVWPQPWWKDKWSWREHRGR